MPFETIEPRLYVPSKPANIRCSAKYLLVALIIVSLVIALLGYLARERHTSAVVALPADAPMEEQQSGSAFMDTANNYKPLTKEGEKELTLQDAPKREEDNVFIQVGSVAQASFQNKAGSQETNYLEPVSVWQAVEDNMPQTSQIPANHPVTQSTVNNDSGDLGLLGRLWSTLWSNEKEKTAWNETESLSGNNTTIISSNGSRYGSEQAVLKSGLTREITRTAHSRVTALLPSMPQYQQHPAPGRYDHFGNRILSSPPPTKTATLPPIGNLPPPCDDYPSSYVKDFVSHALHTGDKEDRYILQDFERAVKSNQELGIIEIGVDLAMYSLVAASMGRPAVVLQPNHICAQNLRKMLQLNALSDLVTVKELGISDKKGFGRFIIEGHENVVIPVSESDVTLERLDNHVIVNTVTLDGVTEYVRFQKAILKVNTGRFHPSMFTAATELFSKIKIHYVFMNWKYEKANEESAIRTISFLKSQELEPRSRLKNGFGLITAFYRYWPEHVIWVNKFPW